MQMNLVTFTPQICVMIQILQKAFDPEDFRANGHQLIDLLADYLADATSGKPMPVLPHSQPDEMLGFWEANFSNPHFDLQQYFATLIRQSNHIHHPHYMGHQVVPPAPLAALTELSEALLNNGMAIYEMGPASTAIEKVIIAWLAKRIGMDTTTEGVLTSGGSAGNLTGLLAARQACVGYNIWQEGNTENSKLAVMVSAEAHYSIARAVKIMGWGEKGIVPIPVTNALKADASLLQQTYDAALTSGLNVIAIVGNACTTSTGSYDPLLQLGEFARKNNLWFHVDGAHGGAAGLTEKYRHLTHGIEMADSVVIDFHKMLLAPALTTAVLFRNGRHSYETFAQKAEYLLGSGDQAPWYNSAGRALECTKKMMGVKVYALIKHYGEELLSDYITYCYDLGIAFGRIINLTDDFVTATEPQSNIVCFRYIPQSFTGNINEFTREIRRRLSEDQEFYVVQTQVRGEIYLRVTLMNPFTTEMHLNLLLNKIRTLAKSILLSE